VFSLHENLPPIVIVNDVEEVASRQWLRRSSFKGVAGRMQLEKGSRRLFRSAAVKGLTEASWGGRPSTSTAASHRSELLKVVLTSSSPFHFWRLLFRKGGAQKTSTLAKGSCHGGTCQQMVCSYGWALQVSVIHRCTLPQSLVEPRSVSP
jgi:hypothetical protein